MRRSIEIEAQTEIRRRLLQNGYTPLANKDKMCVLPGWSHLPVDEAQIDAWSQQYRWRATGVRVENRLAVIDLDVDDAEAIEAIVDAIPDDIWERLRAAPIRRGKGAKEAWFCRLAEGEEPFYRLASAGFRRAPEDETVQRVEIFAGDNGGRQFGAYGAHTIGESGDVDVSYRWVEDRGLCDVALEDLPVLTRAEFALVAEIASRTLEGIGWHPDLLSKPGFSSGAPVYDLHDGMIFETRDHGEVGLAELEDLCAAGDEVRLSASWLEGPAAVNMTRCIASLHPRDGRLSILETASFEIHRPADLAPKPVTQSALDRLRSLSEGSTIFTSAAPAAPAPEPTTTEVGAQMADDMSAVTDALLHDVAFCPSEQRCVMPIDGGPERAMTMSNFTTLMRPWSVEVRGPRGGVQMINPATLWAADPRRVTVGGYRFRPDLSGQRLVPGDGDGMVYINTYREPVAIEVDASDVASARDAFEALLAHLVPDDDDRAWFRMWLASKVQRPWLPNCGVILVAEQQGTGRGTLFDMLQVAIGRAYVRAISSVELMGGGGQGQYNDWLASSLLVLCEEVMAGDDAGGAMAWKRREMYERLKQLVDPRQRIVEIRRKGLQNYSAEVFASVLMATNHLNALPLDHADRRIAVLVQPEVKFDDNAALRALVNPHRASGRFSEEFGAALRAHLMSVPVDFDALRTAPELSGGRDLMRDNNEGDVESLLRAVLSRIPGDFVTYDALRRRMQNAVTAEGEGDHLRNWWRRAQDALRGTNAFGWRGMPMRQMVTLEDGTRRNVRVYYRVADDGGAAARGAWHAASGADRWTTLLGPSNDVNRLVSALDQAKRDGRLSVIEGGSGA